MIVSQKLKLKFAVKKDGQEYVATCPKLPGLECRAKTLDEAVASIQKATTARVQAMSPDELRRLLDGPDGAA